MASWPSVTTWRGVGMLAILKARLMMKMSFKSSSTSRTVNLWLSIRFFKSIIANVLAKDQNAKHLHSRQWLLNIRRDDRLRALETAQRTQPLRADRGSLRDRERKAMPAGGVDAQEDLRAAGHRLCV